MSCEQLRYKWQRAHHRDVLHSIMQNGGQTGLMAWEELDALGRRVDSVTAYGRGRGGIKSLLIPHDGEAQGCSLPAGYLQSMMGKGRNKEKPHSLLSPCFK